MHIQTTSTYRAINAIIQHESSSRKPHHPSVINNFNNNHKPATTWAQELTNVAES